MYRSQDSGSGSNSNANSGGTNLMGELRCHCGKLSVVKKAWTDENPGRRFYGCGDVNWKSCNFFRWLDVEKPYGWQKTALLEARDLIRLQVEELKQLRALVGNESEIDEGKEIESRIQKSKAWLEMEDENKKLKQEIVSNIEKEKLVRQMEDENKKLKQEITASIEKEKLVRQFVIISWIGFVCATAVIVNALK